ncbi:MAG: hypothetical protein D4S02_07895 [Rhodocyclaceae bacterium]|nr:MAG: hypothetical protein D4S02_07895 [Rhodocyclaceae bacterium]
MRHYERILLYVAIAGSMLLAGADAAATELGELCWMTEKGTLLRFSVSESGPGHYTYTGTFDDADGAAFAVVGHVSVSGGTLIGSFSGAKSSADKFKTAIYRVAFDPGTLAGTAEGIRHSANNAYGSPASGEYRIHTLTPTHCP